MKRIITILFLLPLISSAQTTFSLSGTSTMEGFNKCGTWEPLPVTITEWESVDTLGKVTTTKRDWVYGKEEKQQPGFLTFLSVYCPCGCNPRYSEAEYRICKITGIKQIRSTIHDYKYIEPEKSDYEKTIESFTTKPK